MGSILVLNSLPTRIPAATDARIIELDGAAREVDLDIPAAWGILRTPLKPDKTGGPGAEVRMFTALQAGTTAIVADYAGVGGKTAEVTELVIVASPVGYLVRQPTAARLRTEDEA